jgi:hypothetical protein
MNPSWKNELPRKSGFYWYKNSYGEARIVEFDKSSGMITAPGHEPDCWDRRVRKFKFWSQRITIPVEKKRTVKK